MSVLPRLAISERAFQDQVIELARLLHYRVYHAWSSQHSAAGFPDLVLTRRGRLIFAELKSETGKVRPEQCEWLEELEACGGPVEVYLWRAGTQWDEIVAILRRDEERKGNAKGKGKKGAQGGRTRKRSAGFEPVGTGSGSGGDRVDGAVPGIHAVHPRDARRRGPGGDARMDSPAAGRRVAESGTGSQRRAAGTRAARAR